MQIIGSSTPCGEFFFWSYHTLKSEQRVGVASPGSRTQPCAAEERARDIATIVKQSHELDLNIIIIWKVGNPRAEKGVAAALSFILWLCVCVCAHVCVCIHTGSRA